MLALGGPEAWPRSRVFQYTTADTNENRLHFWKEKKMLKRKGQDSKRVKDFNVPEDPRKTSEVISPQIYKLLTQNE